MAKSEPAGKEDPPSGGLLRWAELAGAFGRAVFYVLRIVILLLTTDR